MERCQTEGFKSHLWRIPHEDGNYHYEVEYIVDPQGDPLPDTYMASYQRHKSLRKAFSGLEPEAQAEFTSRLTKGLEKKYWRNIRVAPALRHLSLFLMDFDTETKELTAKVTEHSKLVTIQALALIMGVSQSPAYLSLAFQDFTKDIQDQQQ